MSQPEPVAPLVEHFFRREAGRLVAVLTRFFGWRNFDLVEEMVQSTLLDALQSWRARGIPDNPSAWIHRVARNKILDSLRRAEIHRRASRNLAALHVHGELGIDDLFLDTSIEDSQLRMIFACCHPALSRENQLALTLKTLCGFGIPEIARALLVSEETIKKRLQRATKELVDRQITLDPPDTAQLIGRLEAVHQVLYLIFNEGHTSSKGETAIRHDLCEDAAYLCHLLCAHAQCSTPTTKALMALMLFHAARLDARLDPDGAILLMEDQDRALWDRRLIERAREFLDLSAEGTTVSIFHLEAGIALIHCSAPTYKQTDWRAILNLYDAMIAMHDSPVYVLNRAIVVAEIEGPKAGIRALEAMSTNPAISHYHLFDATLGELYRRSGELEMARRYLETARKKTRSPHDRAIIDRRLSRCLAPVANRPDDASAGTS
jgi:RNA polymerase sigma-70 factor (ECF subfamily)